MSSRILEPGDVASATPMVWRQVNSGQVATVQSPVVFPKVQAPDNKEQMAQLEQQWQARVREAHAAGTREGEAAGKTRGAAEIQPAVDRMARAVAELAQMRSRLRKEAEADTVKLALAIARRVLRRELAVDPEALQGLLVSALERLQSQEISRVRVHPSYTAMVSACLQKSAYGNAIEVLGDPTREPGDVIFETQCGNLDASVDSQLQEIERGLTDRLRKQS
jgi:flagellar assembly protein FliH